MRMLGQALFVAFIAASVAAAQVDPPGRVARLNYLSGQISFQPGGADEWVGAPLNRPLTTGDKLWVEQDGRAELHMGSAAFRLNSRTAFEFLNLNDDNVQVRLAEGSVEIRLRRLDENESFEIDTPNLAFSLLRPGIYRIDADPDSQTTTISVRGGEGQVNGGGQTFTLKPGQQARVTGDQSITYDVASVRPPDWFDDWCSSRDRREDRSESARYVPRDMIGYEDLDDQGSWRPVTDYGNVWFPRTVSAGWAPYREGHWAWIEPWGWTWIDQAPWGFAPFHYGRWAFIGNSWGWMPGPVVVRPVYVPALVAWVGGPRFHASIGIGAGVAWFPLGPREAFIPAYRSSPTYVSRVNNTTIINNINVTNVNNVTYVNQRAPNAVTAVSRETFVGGRRINSSIVTLPVQAVDSGMVVRSAQIAPTRASLYGEGRMGAQAPAANVFTRAVVNRRAPPPAVVPFVQRQEALQQNAGRPLEPAQVERIRNQHQAQPARAVTHAMEAVPQPGRVENVRPVTEHQNPVPLAQPQPRVERESSPRRPDREPSQQIMPRVERERVKPVPQVQPMPQPQPHLERERAQPRVEHEAAPRTERPAPEERRGADRKPAEPQKEKEKPKEDRRL